MFSQWTHVIATVTLLVGPFAAGPQAAPAESVVACAAVASESPATPPKAQAFDPAAATDAYLAALPADQRERSDRYFEGRCWLQVWNYAALSLVCMVLLVTGSSARMRDVARSLTASSQGQLLVYWVEFALLLFLLTLPLAIYGGFIREHHYGLSNQTLGSWLMQAAKQLAVSLAIGAVFLMLFYAMLRRAPRTWWAWATGGTVALLVATRALAPLVVDPLFNEYRPLAESPLKQRILSLARANGVPAENVYVVDESRQSTRVSAHVSGMFGTLRISLNDNLLARCTPQEVEAVMGHEMGHYVLNHLYTDLLFYGVLVAIGYLLVHRVGGWSLRRWGDRWHIHGLADTASLPLLVFIVASFAFVCTPVTNSYVRAREYQADLFGLNAAGQPDGGAAAALRLAQYRKLDPGPIEEFIWFDHPSGRSRIFAAMRWKAEHLRATSPRLADYDTVPTTQSTAAGVVSAEEPR